VVKVSVVMPCYNYGRYVDEAVDSVLCQTFQDFEIIIVNDGSTDAETNDKLAAYHKPKTRVFRTENRGLAAARNFGIQAATGQYVLPLDADDKIAPTYLEKAVGVLDENENAGIVYCEAEFFGAETGKWELPPYQFPDMLLRNFIFCSAFFRKSDWERTRGYQPMFGWEDYDFWLSLIELGRDVVRIPEILFHYRRMPGSMIKTMSREQQMIAHERIFNNHLTLYSANIRFVFEEIFRLNESASKLYEMSVTLQRQAEIIDHLQNSALWRLYERCVRWKNSWLKN
jgi:glycosyltransferase involved in cell wall biosynthesis